jgi:hypothetical protein
MSPTGGGVLIKSDGFFKTAIDKESGQYAIADSDRTTVSLCDKNGSVLWSTNILAGVPRLRVVGERKIWAINVYGNIIIAHVGNTLFAIDKQTGSLQSISSQ